jgi:hypothetical protein
MELAETLMPVRIPEYRSLLSFSLVGYTIDDAPVLKLDAEVTLDVHLSSGGVETLATDPTIAPVLHVWDPQAADWQELPTTWDPVTGTARATSSQIGTFALSTREYRVYLPLILKHAS